ncbi:protein kinase domain containing protein [Entamoeba histolytica HM-1:IMSS-B]|uniref:Protein kinase domain containing protein n=6 Tax=Entamoeba histolytica TaxID=5759 RepID=C4LZY2_ENTH1|nr:protein kinase domain containing protein [Entamoeba histolytica HM-1:IMSS]EMD47043.1 protein kinase domain containing protein [Entamoeba histolytica KU27]EMH74946.1 protein kinase domain containing protein [Entamoeba histolytica HM-1:IMSS-B]EMS14171.1 protein kinase domain containing protein [Entamoeba histolytica HM-3:IMSS]ENY62190.1 protein kinase domain containing protein [Entamoeba histolytica HM-1:IMSS-A]GAT94445.1 protein kinase domain containing protein [Entamoeba histolytica]|eukprot:XP_653642.1 protein kinase domain containing protein [Entamoeba histolytica HM-1:IMSS]
MNGQLIGCGTFGKVYKSQTEDGEIIAVKEFNNQSTNNELKLQTFREIKFLQQLRHEKIIKIKNFIVEQNTLFIIMPFIPNNLEKEIKKKHSSTISFEELISWITPLQYQFFEVLKYLHSLHIVHRDIKPSNFLLTDKQQIQLIDFGNAYHYHSNELVKANCVTPNYRPPEGDLNILVNPQSIDVFSIGCVLFEMISGKLFLQLSNNKTIFDFINSTYSFDANEILMNPSITIPTTLTVSQSLIDSSIPYHTKNTYDFFNKLLNLNSNLRPSIDTCAKLILF